MRFEYRVRWQREGRHPHHRIFQSWDAACRKVRALIALDKIKGEFTIYDDMEDLVGPPTLQVREVGEWRDHLYQPQACGIDEARLRDHAKWREPVTASDSEGSEFVGF